MAGTGTAGFETKTNDLKQFFVKTTPPSQKTTPTP